ncbi:MAG: glycosyltransferase family 2 protein [Planctomycetota bacterium]|nr:glycosyltransferase family 2 protein [Planctomycetota bacterium]
MRVTIVTPIYNEEGNLRELADRVVKVMEAWRAGHPAADWEMLACDDCSTDGGPAILEELAAKNPRLRVLRNPSRGGQTAALAAGFRHASGDVVVTMDADLQVFPEDLPLLLAEIESGRAELVNGRRARRQHNCILRATSALGNAAMRLLFRVPVRDAASNYMAVMARYLKDLPLAGNDHRYLVPILMRRGVRKIVEVAVRHEARRSGRSKYGLLKGIRGLPEMIRAYFRMRRGFYDPVMVASGDAGLCPASGRDELSAGPAMPARSAGAAREDRPLERSSDGRNC